MWQVLTVVILFAMMVARSSIPGADSPNLVMATGFVLLAAFTIGELFKRISLPALLGYIVAGFLFGPHLVEIVLPETWQLTILPDDITDSGKLAYVETLTVGVIGTLGGGELKVADLKEQFGTIVAIAGLSLVAIVPISGFAVYGLTLYYPEAIPFLVDVPFTARATGCALFGLFSYAMSPAATLAIIQETKSEGPYTSLVLGTVIVAELTLVALYLLTAAFGGVVIETGGLDWGAIAAELPTIGMEFGWALIIGAITGMVFILYFRFVAREMIFFTVGAIFVTSYVATQLHAEKLLAFIVAGFIVQNLSRHGHDMIEALEQISLPVFVVYFTLTAAGLKLGTLPQYVVITLVLTALRTIGIFAAVQGAIRLVDVPLSELKQRHLWLGFFSRGSVDLVLASLLAQEAATFGPWVADFQAVIIAMVVVHIVAGPPILQFALGRVGERGGGEPDEEPEPEADDEAPEDEASIDPADPLAEPDVADPEMQERLEGLRSRLTRRFRTRVVQSLRSHKATVDRVTDQLEESIAEAVDDLHDLLEEADPESTDDLEELADAVFDLHESFRRQIQPQIDTVERLDTVPVSATSMDALLDESREMVDPDLHYEVEWDETIWEPQPDDRLRTRGLKALRRLRRALFGPGERTVEVGQLWRYYLELGVPHYFADAVENCSHQSEEYWFEIDEQLREIDAVFENLARTLSRGAEPTPDDSDDVGRLREVPETEVPLSASPAAVPYYDDDGADASFPGVDLESDQSPVEPDPEAAPEQRVDETMARCREQLDAFDEKFERRREAVESARLDFRDDLLELLAEGLRASFDDFLEGVSVAGTIQLQSFQFRPSTRFDRARDDEARIRTRLEHESRVVGGYQGWMVLDQQLVMFLHWFRDYRDRVVDVLDTEIREKCLEQLRNLETRCADRPEELDRADGSEEADAASPAETVDWRHWLEEQIRPSLRSTRTALDETLYRLERGNATQPLLEALESRVNRFPDELDLLVERTDESPDSTDLTVVSTPIRRWYMVELIREAALRFVEFNEHAERSLRRTLQEVEKLERVLVFNLETAQGQFDAESEREEADETALGALERAEGQVADLADELVRDEDELRQWIDRELSRIVYESSGPFLLNQVTELQERLGERTSSFRDTSEPSWLDRIVDPVRRGAGRVWDATVPAAREFTDNLHEALTEEEKRVDRAEARRYLLEHDPDTASDVPVIYRRLFTPVPVDIPDFYVPRPDLEDDCLAVAEEWFEGRDNSLLLYGDRGMGKRTLIQHLLPSRLFEAERDLDRDQVSTIRLGRRVPEERALCHALSTLVDRRDVDSLETLGSMLNNQSERRVVFVENGHSLFTRTPHGMELCRRFWRLIGETSDQVFWVVMMGRAAAEFLDTRLSLFDRFTHVFELPPFETEAIEEIIASRHRVSGFDLDFESPEASVVDRLRHPIAASEAARHPRRAYFDRLGRLSRGNPMLALLYWLGSVHPDPTDDARLVVEPLPEDEMHLTPVLSRRQQMIVAVLVQHGYVTVDTLGEIFRHDLDDLRSDVDYLVRLGVAELEPGRRDVVGLRPFSEALLTPELRDENLI